MPRTPDRAAGPLVEDEEIQLQDTGQDPSVVGGISLNAGAIKMRDSTGVFDARSGTGVPPGRTLTAGAGLTGGGDLSADRTFDVGANADGSIVVNADDVQVGVLATDAQHGARGGGTQHATATQSVAGFMSAQDKTDLDAIVPFGQERQGLANDAEVSTSTKGAWFEVLTFTTSTLPAGDYLLMWYVEVKHQSPNNRLGVRVQLDDTTDVFLVDAYPVASMFFPESGWKVITVASPAALQIDIDIDQNTGGPPRTIYARNRRVYLWRLS